MIRLRLNSMEFCQVRLAREAEEMRFSEKVFRAQQQKEQQLRRDAAKEVLKGTEAQLKT